MSDSPFTIAVLVSAGRHPVSGRSRRAPNDARALELGLILAEQYGAAVRVLHAGDPDEPALRGYLGMGVAELHVLPVTPGNDIAGPLVDTLRRWLPRLILTGRQSESGWSSGCLPYTLAEKLGTTLCSNIDYVAIPVDSDRDSLAELRQVCPHGRRRMLRARLPAIVTVDTAAAAARQSAFARARRGRLITESWQGEPALPPFVGEARPARRRPKRLQKSATGGSADQRLQVLTSTAGGGGRILEAGAVNESAKAIHAYLVEHGLCGPDHRPDAEEGELGNG